jgi:hypothetical protein
MKIINFIMANAEKILAKYVNIDGTNTNLNKPAGGAE